MPVFIRRKKTAFAIGVINATMMIGNFIGALLCGVLAPRWGIVSVYLAAATIAGCACLLCLFFVQETKGKHQEPLSFPELYSVIKVPNVVYYSVLCALALAIFVATGQTITPLAAEHIFAASVWQLSVLSGITIFASAVSCMICDFIPARMSEKEVLLCSFAVTVLANTLVPLCFFLFYALFVANHQQFFYPIRLYLPASIGGKGCPYQTGDCRDRPFSNHLLHRYRLRPHWRRSVSKDHRRLPLDFCFIVPAASYRHGRDRAA